MNRLRLKKNALNNLKHPLRAPHLRAEFPERIVRTTRGFTVWKIFHSLQLVCLFSNLKKYWR